MMESGLYDKWEEWQSGVTQMLVIELFRSTEYKFQDASFQVAEFDHLTLINLICISILLTSVLIFSTELGTSKPCQGFI